MELTHYLFLSIILDVMFKHDYKQLKLFTNYMSLAW